MSVLQSLPEDLYQTFKQSVAKIVTDLTLIEPEDKAKASLASEHLWTAWDSKKYLVSDNMQTTHVNNFKQ